MDALSNTDAWVQVSVGGRLIGRTKMIQDDNNPVFNERFEISDYANELIKLTVYDHDVTGETVIGQTIIREPKNGLYPIIGDIDGKRYNRGQLEVDFE